MSAVAHPDLILRGGLVTTLDPSNPTVYIYDGQSRAMESETYTVDVLQQDGSTKPGSRTMWRHRCGG